MTRDNHYLQISDTRSSGHIFVGVSDKALSKFKVSRTKTASRLCIKRDIRLGASGMRSNILGEGPKGARRALAKRD